MCFSACMCLHAGEHGWVCHRSAYLKVCGHRCVGGYVLLCVYISVHKSVCTYICVRSMHVCKHVCLNICVYLLVLGDGCTCVSTWAPLETCVHTPLYKCTRMSYSLGMYEFMCLVVPTCVRLRVHTYRGVCMSVSVHTSLCI